MKTEYVYIATVILGLLAALYIFLIGKKEILPLFILAFIPGFNVVVAIGFIVDYSDEYPKAIIKLNNIFLPYKEPIMLGLPVVTLLGCLCFLI